MDDKNLINNMADDDNIEKNDGSLDNQNDSNLSAKKKDHDILEIINVLSDENSDINTIGREGEALSNRVDIKSAFDDIDEDTSVGRSIINIDRDEIKKSKKWEDSFNKSAGETLDEIMNNRENSSLDSSKKSDTDAIDSEYGNKIEEVEDTSKEEKKELSAISNILPKKEASIQIRPVEKVEKVQKVNLKEDTNAKVKDRNQGKSASKIKISEMFSELFSKHKKLLIIFLISLFIFVAFGIAFYAIVINKPVQQVKIFELDDYTNEHSFTERKRSGTFKVLDEGLFDGGELYFLRDVENRQQLSLVVKSKNGKVLVFDGGWGEDAPKLTSLIKELGGTVNYWFITHGDPDHVGALYEITADDDLMGIKIERIVYTFFKKEIYSILGVEEPWFYEALIDRFMDLSEKKNVAILNDLSLDQIINIDDVKVRILNDTRHLYRVDNYFDNNSSCCYKITMNDKSITVLGDIAKDASDLVLRLNTKDVLKSDIVVLSHHGQDGAKKDLYEAIEPEICLWGTPDWLYENKNGTWDTFSTIKWMKDMGVEKHCISKDGDWIIR